MSDLKRRVNQLEDKAGKGDELPHLPMQQDLDDPEIYYTLDGVWQKGEAYRYGSDEFKALAEKHTIILINWAEAWPPGQEPPDYKPPPDDGAIVLTWGDDDEPSPTNQAGDG